MQLYITKLDRPEPVKLQWLMSTLHQDSPIRGGTSNTQRALQKTAEFSV